MSDDEEKEANKELPAEENNESAVNGSEETTPAAADKESDDEAVAQEAPELTIEEKLAAAEAQSAENHDKYVRILAEFKNAQKRLDNDKINAFRNATISIAEKVLPVGDDFKRALDNVPDEIKANDWLEGVMMVQRKLTALYEHLKLEQIVAVGAEFDPQLHEAIMSEPSEEYESGTVIREYQSGYRIGDRVIRPSMVAVAA